MQPQHVAVFCILLLHRTLLDAARVETGLVSQTLEECREVRVMTRVAGMLEPDLQNQPGLPVKHHRRIKERIRRLVARGILTRRRLFLHCHHAGLGRHYGMSQQLVDPQLLTRRLVARGSERDLRHSVCLALIYRPHSTAHRIHRLQGEGEKTGEKF